MLRASSSSLSAANRIVVTRCTSACSGRPTRTAVTNIANSTCTNANANAIVNTTFNRSFHYQHRFKISTAGTTSSSRHHPYANINNSNNTTTKTTKRSVSLTNKVQPATTTATATATKSSNANANANSSSSSSSNASSPWKRLNVPQSKAQLKAQAQAKAQAKSKATKDANTNKKPNQFQHQHQRHRKPDNNNINNNRGNGNGNDYGNRPKRYPRLQLQNQNQNQNTSANTNTNTNTNTNKSTTSTIQENKKKPSSIDKLRESFMQSLQSDRERRQVPKSVTSVLSSLSVQESKSSSSSNSDSVSSSNSSNSSNSNSESKLDQLLRMSRQASQNNAAANLNSNGNSNMNTNNNSNGIHNRFNNASGAKAFRERRKMQQRQQQQQQQQVQQQGQGYQNRNGNQYHQKRQQDEDRKKLYRLQQELLNNTNVIQQEEIDNMNSSRNSGSSSENNGDNDGERVVILPRKDLTIVELSTILRVDAQKIIHTIKHALGESLPKSLFQKKKGKGGRKTSTSSSSSDDSMDDLYVVDVDMAELIALELGLDPQRAKRSSCLLNDAERRILRQNNGEEDDDYYEDGKAEEILFPSRPPVVCIMGHVDHGKTTLMDSLRQRALDANGGMKAKNKGKKKKGGGGKKKKGGGGDNDGNVVHKVAGTEAGGITQTVSAFQVALPTSIDDDDASASDAAAKSSGASTTVDKVTFLDTPGHAAFKAMRQSGSNGADVIVLVIAADDGVSPQTVEIIDMYKSIAKAQPGSISLVVAMTKIDKPGIDVDESIMRIENQLLEYDIYSENMSHSGESEFGAVQLVPVSGLTGDGLDDLIESLALHSEIMDLRADPEARAEGLIIDAKVEKGLGVVADCIVRWGKLELGDYVVSGTHGGKVRILNDVNNKAIKKASPSQPVRIVGLQTLPKAGDPIVCVQSEELAKEIISRREALNAKESHRAESSDAQLEVEIVGGASKKGFMARNVLNRYGLGDMVADEGDDVDKEKVQKTTDDDTIRIPIILKADADGTLAALRDTILAIQDESKLNLCIDPIAVSIGHVTPSDVRMAADSAASIFCFNLKGSKDKVAMGLAATENVEIRSHDVIYHLLDEAKDVFSTYCPPTPFEQIHGKATVKAVFDINNNKDAEKVAGLMVQEGSFYLDKSSKESGSLHCKYRVHRGGEIITPEGVTAKSLRKVKEEVSSVRRGEECGLNLNDFFDIQEGDIIECYSVEMKRMFV